MPRSLKGSKKITAVFKLSSFVSWRLRGENTCSLEMKNNSLKILYLLADRGHDLTRIQGYTVHVQKILENLRKKNHRPFLLTINDHAELPGFENYTTLPHVYCRGVHKLMPYTGALNSLRVFRKIIKLDETNHFDLIHERYGLYSSGGAIAARFLNIPYFLEVNAPLIEEKQLFTSPMKGVPRWIAEIISRMNYRFADHIFVVSKILQSYLAERADVSSAKMSVLPNAADAIVRDERHRLETRERFGLNSEVTVGYVGTFQPWFGVENLVKALPTILSREKKVIFLFIGDGEARKKCDVLSQQLGVRHKIKFINPLSHEKLEELLAILDIGVAPYKKLTVKFYGSSMKVFDYMAGGSAIVASDIGQVSEIVEHEKTGLLVPPGDSNALANAVLRLVQNAKFRRRLGDGAKEKLQQKYTWTAYADRLIQMYQKYLT